MPMTKNQVIDLIKLIRSYDNRNLDEASVTAWAEQAILGRWEADEAFAAVREHFRDSTEWLKPGHINQILRAHRRQPATVSELRAAGALPATPHVPPALEEGAAARNVSKTDKRKTQHSLPVMNAYKLLLATYGEEELPTLEDWYQQLNPPGTEPWPKNVLAVALAKANARNGGEAPPVSQYVSPTRPRGQRFARVPTDAQAAAAQHLAHITNRGKVA